MPHSYFELTLDTTAPELTLLIPATVNKDRPTVLGVAANEDLATLSCWLVDGSGASTVLDMIYSDGVWAGGFTFHAETLGRCTMYAQATDAVGNATEITSVEFFATDKTGGVAEIRPAILGAALVVETPELIALQMAPLSVGLRMNALAHGLAGDVLPVKLSAEGRVLHD